MCRKGDTGPYALGNVRIDTHRENIKEAMSEIHTFISPEGTLYTSTSLRQFAAEHGLNHRLLSNLVRGTAKKHKGWRYAERSKVTTC